MTLKERFEEKFKTFATERAKSIEKINGTVEVLKSNFPRVITTENHFDIKDPFCSVTFNIHPPTPVFLIEAHIYPDHISFQKPQNILHLNFENVGHFIDELARQVANHGKELAWR